MSLKSWLVRRLERMFQIHEGEWRRLLLLFLLYFLVIGGIMFGRNARDSLFLKNFGIQYLPYMYVANALFVVLCSVIYNLFIDRVNRFWFVTAANGLFAALILWSWWMLHFGFPWFYPVLYIIAQILWILGMMQFWTLAGDVFNTREAKRLFPVVGMGGLIGMIASGIIIPPLVKQIGTPNLLVIWTALLALSAVVVLIVQRTLPQVTEKEKASPRPATKPSQWEEFKAGLLYVKGTTLLLTLGALTLYLNIIFNIVDYQFSEVINKAFRTRDELTAYMAAFRGLAGLAALLVQLFATSKVINWAGVGRTILFHPSFLVLSTAYMAVDFLFKLPGWRVTGFISANIAKFGDHILLYTIQDSTYNLLFNPIPVEKRGKARGFIDGYLKPLGSGVAGLLLVAYIFVPQPEYLSTIAFVLSGLWLALAFKIRQAYIQTLMDNLASGDHGVRSAAMHALGGLKGEQNLQVLLGIARSNDEALACYAIQILAKQKRKESVPALLEAVRHPKPVIRDAALEALSKVDGKAHTQLFIDFLQDPDMDVRAEAIEALGKIGELDAGQYLFPFLDDPHPKIRAKVVVTLIEVGGIDGILMGAETLKRMLESRDPQERLTAAKALGALKVKHFTPSLLSLVNDPDRNVRLMAVQSLGKIHDPRTTQPLLELLPDRYLGKHALSALVAIGRRSEGELIRALEEPDLRLRVQLGLLEALQKIPYQGKTKPLVPFLRAEHARLRAAALRVLHARALEEEEQRTLRPALLDCLKLEVQDLYWISYYQTVLIALARDEDLDLLQEALERQRIRILEGVFLALGLIGEKDTINHIYSQLSRGDAKGRALALEALETVLQLLQIAVPLLGILDEMGREERLLLCQSVLRTDRLTPIQCLLKLIHHPSDWIRACALYCLSHHADGVGMQPFLEMAEDRDHLVRENAVVGVAAVGGSAGLEKVREFLASPYPEVQYTARVMVERAQGRMK